jgi:hypothetical protein
MRLFLFVLPLIFAIQAQAAELERLGTLTFRGEILAPNNISGIASFAAGEFLAIGGDEGQAVQILKRTGDDRYYAGSGYEHPPPTTRPIRLGWMKPSFCRTWCRKSV